MTFAKPEMLWLLGVTAPLLVWFLVWTWHRRQQLIGTFVQSRLLAQLTVGVARWRQKARLVLVALAAMLLLAALARPQLGFTWEEVRQRGLDIVVAVDTSRSMLAADVSPNRLTRAKLAALDLLKLARSDRLALVAFAGEAFLQCPLTLDDGTFQQSINLLEVDLLPQGGTALGPAILAALDATKDSGDNFKALVLFTDGEDQEDGALAAAEQAAQAGMKIYTVGVGTATGDRLRLVDEQGRSSYVQDENGKPVVSKLNQVLLREIATKTGGDFLPLIGADPMLSLYQARLDRLPKSDLSARLLRQYYERYQWPLALAILLLVAELFLPERRRVSRAQGARLPGRGALPRAAAVLLWLAAGTLPALASSGGALRAYEQGRYGEAEQEYQRLLRKRPEDPRLRFNAGTAAYQAGDLQTATNQLLDATLSGDPELLEHVYYNLGNSLFRLGQHQAAPNLVLTNWQQALRHYDSVLQLNPSDADAKFNRQFVARKVEELEQEMARQQASQSSPDKSSGEDKEPQEQPQDAQRSPSSPESKPESESAPSDPGQPPPNESTPPSSEAPEETPKPQEQSQSRPGEESPSPGEKQPRGEQEKAGGKDEPSQGKEPGKDQPAAQPTEVGDQGATNGTAAATAPAGQMTAEQARRMLEASRLDERVWQKPRSQNARSKRTLRDW